MEILRLHLGTLHSDDQRPWPVHGFVVTHPTAGAVVVDTGIGGPAERLADWRAVDHGMAAALAGHGLAPGDIRAVVNTHLHFDHCGWNSVFPHAPFWVQRRELERARVETPWLTDWFDFRDARFELLDGDAELAPGIRLVATPGHTGGHQSVLVDLDGGQEVLIGDAAYTRHVWRHPEAEPIPGQAEDPVSWRASLARLRQGSPRRVHFCHGDQWDAPL